jgi:GNAT superfamily N-acetyltransferase
MPSAFQLIEVRGPELAPWIDVLGELRIAVFREFPYLYAGDLAYERKYLRAYLDCPHSLVVFARDEAGRTVGATTCLPLADETVDFRAPFVRAGVPTDDVLYLGESIVLPEFRGGGLGPEFFARREAHARRLGLRTTAFCAVDRPADHPARPAVHRPLDAFWIRLGYRRRPELQAVFSWKEVGEEQESPKTLTFWTKTWTA